MKIKQKKKIEKRIYENSGKIRAVMTALIIFFSVYRILMLFIGESYIRFLAEDRDLYFMAYAPFAFMAVDLFLIFYKGKAAAALSIINIILSFPAAVINGIAFISFFPYTILDGEALGMTLGSMAELVIILFLMSAAGILIILNECRRLDKGEVGDRKRPAEKPFEQTTRNAGRILKNNKKIIILIIRLIITAILAAALINKLYTFFEDRGVTGSFYHEKELWFSVSYVFLTLSEIISMFLKGKPSIAVRIANVIAAGGFVAYELIVINLSVIPAIFGYAGENVSFYIKALTESFSLLMAAAWIFIGGLLINKNLIKQKSKGKNI